MKKILAISIIAMTAVTAANAEIASRAYVDQKDTAMNTRMTAAEGSITTLNADANTEGSVAKKIADAIAGQDLTGYVPTTRTVNGHALSENVTVTLGDLSVTATAAEINKLAGNEVTAADLTKLHAVTADAAELNYVDGVTSNIQTQLDAKQATLTSAQQSAVDSGINSTLVGKISSNETAIGILNGDDTTAGSVAKAVKDATDDLTADINAKADAATTLAGYGIADAYTKTETDTAINTKVGTLDGSTTGTGNVVDSVTEADGIVTVTKNVTAVTVPTSNENSEAGTYVLTSEIAQDGTKTYHWELITRATSAQP